MLLCDGFFNEAFLWVLSPGVFLLRFASGDCLMKLFSIICSGDSLMSCVFMFVVSPVCVQCCFLVLSGDCLRRPLFNYFVPLFFCMRLFGLLIVFYILGTFDEDFVSGGCLVKPFLKICSRDVLMRLFYVFVLRFCFH